MFYREIYFSHLKKALKGCKIMARRAAVDLSFLVRSPKRAQGTLVGKETGVSLEGRDGVETGRVFARSNRGSLSTHLVRHATSKAIPMPSSQLIDYSKSAPSQSRFGVPIRCTPGKTYQRAVPFYRLKTTANCCFRPRILGTRDPSSLHRFQRYTHPARAPWQHPAAAGPGYIAPPPPLPCRPRSTDRAVPE
jgi:hypothetical protein